VLNDAGNVGFEYGRVLGLKFRGTSGEGRNSGFRIQDSGFGMRDAGFRGMGFKSIIDSCGICFLMY
jgi:hypothetical protein